MYVQGGMQAIVRRTEIDTKGFSELLQTTWAYAQLFDWPLPASIFMQLISSCTFNLDFGEVFSCMYLFVSFFFLLVNVFPFETEK